MGWPLATRDTERYRRYFPNVKLIEFSKKVMMRFAGSEKSDLGPES